MCNSVPSSFLLHSKFCLIIVLCCKFFKSNKEGSDLLIKVALESLTVGDTNGCIIGSVLTECHETNTRVSPLTNHNR